MSVETLSQDKTTYRNLRITKQKLSEKNQTIAYQTTILVKTWGDVDDITRKFICFRKKNTDQGWKYGKGKMTYRAFAMQKMENDVNHFVRLYGIK